MVLTDMEPSSVYSDLMAATRQSMRMRRRSAGSFGGSGRWSVDTQRKINRKKADKNQEETNEHVVLLLCKFLFFSGFISTLFCLTLYPAHRLAVGLTNTKKRENAHSFIFSGFYTFTFDTGCRFTPAVFFSRSRTSRLKCGNAL